MRSVGSAWTPGCAKWWGIRCESERGYRPMLAVWAEMSVVEEDEFRDGIVPAMMSPLTAAKLAYAAWLRLAVSLLPIRA